MENTIEEQDKMELKKKSKFKPKILIALFLLIIAAMAYGYYWYNSTKNLRIEAQGVVDKAIKYDNLSAEIETERNRCENFITQQEGDFGSFEYCKKFLDWSNLK